jgi:hypothetical protein
MRYLSLKLTLSFLAICALSGCLETTSQPALVSDSSCLAFTVIHPSTEDVLTLDTKRQILAHNKIYRALCSDSVTP